MSTATDHVDLAMSRELVADVTYHLEDAIGGLIQEALQRGRSVNVYVLDESSLNEPISGVVAPYRVNIPSTMLGGHRIPVGCWAASEIARVVRGGVRGKEHVWCFQVVAVNSDTSPGEAA